ncbi:MAG TPA: hypothetical protein VK699_14450 [Terriglobales bacterium]|jgi:hypothetical protein|nr:hypothetical protein [Terriglobales bacterium]
MKTASRFASMAWIALCVMFLALPARAGDCASPDDCSAIPDNGTKAACGLGILAGYGLYQRSQKQKPDPEEGSSVSTDESLLFGGGSTGGGNQVASTMPPAKGPDAAPPDAGPADPGGLNSTGGPPDGPLGE